jgi:hypothetical protein
MHFQQSSAGIVSASEQSKDDTLFEEGLKTLVLFRVCIARTVHFTELAPSKHSELVVSAASLKVQEHQSAGVGIELKVYFSICFNNGQTFH